MKKDSGLLSIGEFSEVTRASIASLRYFERKGVLKPAYIDPDSGYRYYTLNQIYEISLAKTFTEAGIPLSDLKHYSETDAAGKLNDIFVYCEEVAARAYREAFSTAMRTMEYRKSYQDQIAVDRITDRECMTQNHLLLITPLNKPAESITYRDCVTKISGIVKFAFEKDIVFLSEQGVIRYADNWYAFLNVYREPGVELKVSTSDEYMLVDSPPRKMMVRSVISADISNCFERAFNLVEGQVPSIIQEAWGYSLATDFYSFDSYYDIE